MRRIDLNADIGEIEGSYGRELDSQILDVVTSCNIACGGHAGDTQSMHSTLEAAHSRGVLIGAHPSYPDRENFGRVSGFKMPGIELENSLVDQIRSLLSQAEIVGASVAFVKPHGALYNDAAKDAELAQVVCRSCTTAGLDELVGPPESELQYAARRSGIRFIAEGFVDRAYQADGSLAPRSTEGAVLCDSKQIVEQALSFANGLGVRTLTGETIALAVETLCLHGDTVGAARLAQDVRSALEKGGIRVLSHNAH